MKARKLARTLALPLLTPSSSLATKQTEGFSNEFKLVYTSAATAHHDYEQFLADGTLPPHGNGPWVVFAGRTPGVFTSL